MEGQWIRLHLLFYSSRFESHAQLQAFLEKNKNTMDSTMPIMYFTALTDL